MLPDKEESLLKTAKHCEIKEENRLQVISFENDIISAR